VSQHGSDKRILYHIGDMVDRHHDGYKAWRPGYNTHNKSMSMMGGRFVSEVRIDVQHLMKTKGHMSSI